MTLIHIERVDEVVEEVVLQRECLFVRCADAGRDLDCLLGDTWTEIGGERGEGLGDIDWNDRRRGDELVATRQ